MSLHEKTKTLRYDQQSVLNEKIFIGIITRWATPAYANESRNFTLSLSDAQGTSRGCISQTSKKSTKRVINAVLIVFISVKLVFEKKYLKIWLGLLREELAETNSEKVK